MLARSEALLAVALASIAGASAVASAAGEANPPQILRVQYVEGSEEGTGHRHEVGATIKFGRPADRVKARSGSVWAEGELSDTVGRGGKAWYFRDRKFVKSVRADLEDDGFAQVTVRARNDAGAVSKRCDLNLDKKPADPACRAPRCVQAVSPFGPASGAKHPSPSLSGPRKSGFAASDASAPPSASGIGNGTPSTRAVGDAERASPAAPQAKGARSIARRVCRYLYRQASYRRRADIQAGIRKRG